MIEIDRLSYWYPSQETPALNEVSLSLEAGSVTLVVGHSGSGKSTLLRALNGLVPHFTGGRIAGRVRVASHDPITLGPAVMSRHVGLVFQDPESQRVADVVEDEIAFALENAALPRDEMRQRVQSLLEQLELAPLRDRALSTLSGGERQRVAIAASLALHPQLLILDEPTSQLDPQSAEEVLALVMALNQRWGLTVVLTEHRLERVLALAEHMVLLAEGEVVAEGSARQVAPLLDPAPPLVTLGRSLHWSPLPLSLKEALPHATAITLPAPAEPAPPTERAPLLTVEDVWFAYEEQQVLQGIELKVRRGESVALMGRNGSGKSTLLRSIVGLIRPQRGRIEVGELDVADHDVATICRSVGYLPQNPNALLFAERVEEELLITLRNHGLTAQTAPVAPSTLLDELGLIPFKEDYPRDLSVGQRQRVALGAILVTQPQLVLLDEPTRGLDYGAKAALQALIERWQRQGQALVLVTHDVELAAAVAERVVILEEGAVVDDGPASSVLRHHPAFTPQVAHLFPSQPWLTPADALAALHPTARADGLR